MDWLQFVAQWLHVFLGIFWFGAALYADFILIPAISTLPLPSQREIGGAIGVRSAKVITPVAGLVILLGIIRGTVFGPIKSLDVLTTTYGLTWLLALIFAVGTLLWGVRVIVPAIERMNAISLADAVGPDGSTSPALVAAIDRVKRVSSLELFGFFVIFTCMILMRFGL
jgi:uncharacterized membrane protein